MKPAYRPLLLAFSLISAAAFAAAPERTKTSYPLFGILQVDPSLEKGTLDLNDRSTFEPLRYYRLIYTNDSQSLRTVRDAKQRYGFSVPVIVYMGGFTTNNEAQQVEELYREAIAMIDLAALASPLDARSKQVEVREGQDREFPFVPSTADCASQRDPHRYCFWIQSDRERMRVVAVNAAARRLTVERGFDSAAAAHQAGASLWAPVYVGNRRELNDARHSNSWPDGPNALRYALDPGSPAAQRFKGDLIVALMKSGYDGAWWDTFQIKTFNLCDPLGRHIEYSWDFRGSQRYDRDSYTAALQSMLRAVRKQVKEATGHEPVLVANSVTTSYAQGGKALFSSPERPGLLDAYCFEDSYVQPQVERTRGSRLKASFHAVRPERWLQNVRNERDAAENCLAGLCMMGPAGYLAAYINPSLDNYEQLLRFSWCSYLLTVTNRRSTAFGLPLLVTQRGGSVGFLPLPDLFFYALGDPLDQGEIETLQVRGTRSYLRRFSGGLVAVNPSDKADIVAIPAGYGDAKTGAAVTEAHLPAGDAVLLTRR